MSSARTSSGSVTPLEKRLQAFGCPELIRLDEPLAHAGQIEYLDLLPRRGGVKAPFLSAVAEHQGTALLYILDAEGDQASDPATIARLQRQLANRSDPAWLGIARPGSLEIYPVGFHEEASTSPREVVSDRSPVAPLFFQNLVHATFSPEATIPGTDYVFHKIYGLLTQTTDEYVGKGGRPNGLDALDVLSMAGRALFFRFLIDRRIVLDSELQEICPAAAGLKDSFASAEKAAQTSAWLDETFNGDFLPLIDESIPATDRVARQEAYGRFYRRVERRVGKRFFDHLHAILNGWKKAGDGLQMALDWGDLDFAHIPVGVLSQVYESFSHRADPEEARERSVHYTPRAIARLMVDQAFAALPDRAGAQVLDPACGAGIFLVLAFRRLVSERWLAEGKRPDTRTIQSILYRQLRGFDVSRPALRLAALALYVTAIEVNGTQRPPKSLKFPRNLRNEVLYCFGPEVADGAPGKSGQPERSTFVLGSLGPQVPSEFSGVFDLVIGNPPWTRLREAEAERSSPEGGTKRAGRSRSEKLNDEFTRIGVEALRERGLNELADGYENPDKNPDLPFLWRATLWAKKESGLLALALPARLFGRTTGKGYEAWKAILRSVSITGLINGADLRKSPVWDGVDMPFCLFFARNAVPPRDHRFVFSAPLREPELNQQSRFRLDYEAARPVSVDRVERQPWVLKALSLGTWRDVEVVEALLRAFPCTLAEVWKAWNPEEDKTGQGFNLSPGLAQKPASFLSRLKVFSPPLDGFAVDVAVLRTYLQTFGLRSAHMPRTEALYEPPLVIVPKAPGADPLMPKAFLSSTALAFSQSYYGYSCAGHPDEGALAALLFLLVHSTLFRFFVAMTSVSQGADRMMFTKQDLDTIPFPELSQLGIEMRARIEGLALRTQATGLLPIEDIDSAIFGLYGLDDGAVATVCDTLFSAALYRRQGKDALERTTRATRQPFARELSDLLAPYFEVCGERILVEEPREQPDAWQQPWTFLAISREGSALPVNASLLRAAMAEANQRSASRILVKAPGKRGLLLGLLNQRRWWTITRARLCAQAILRDHLDALGLTESA